MNIKDLLEHCKSIQASSDGKTWAPCRPQTAENTFLKRRLKAAWAVLMGRADAVTWEPKP